jgi:hypothetical protein
VVLVSLLKYKSQGFQGTFRRVPSFMCEGSLRWLWLFLNFGRKWFWLSYKELEVPYCAKHIAGNGFLSKRIGFWCLDVEILKTKTKFLQATGGTLRIHRRNPFEGTVWSVGPILDYPENALAEPNFGYRLIRQG